MNIDIDAENQLSLEQITNQTITNSPNQRDGMSPGSSRSADQERSKHKIPKRSCNTCRQQKLRCDVVQSPFRACSRCRRTGRNCKVEKTFQPGPPKSSRMQLEIEDLRRQLALATQGRDLVSTQPSNSQFIGESVSHAQNTISQRLGDHVVSGEILDDLYKLFFKRYHAFLPFLDPEKPTNHYFQLLPLLGWSVVMVAARRYEDDPQLLKTLAPDFEKLLWSTIQELPQSYHISKALCLLCFWPLPETQNFKGPTYQLSGIMMQIATQNMLHVPLQTQLMPFKKIPESEQRDRVLTWVACNIVAQSISNVYGFLSQANFRFILGSNQDHLLHYNIPQPLMIQLKVAEYCYALTEKLYCNNFDSSGLPSPEQRPIIMNQLSLSYRRLETDLHLDSTPADASSTDLFIPKLHLFAAHVQLHAFSFLIPSSSQLLIFYDAVCIYLQSVTDFETSFGSLLDYSSALIFRTILSCILALLKLLNSPLTKQINVDHGKALFNAAVLTARRMSIQKDDFEYRMSTTIPEMWRELGAGMPWDGSRPDPLILEVQSRMSFSHGYDCLYHYLEKLKAKKVPAGNQEMLGSAGNVPCASGVEVTDQLNESLLAPLEDMEFFNSMDWMLGDVMFPSFESVNFSA